jgi:hypothetical protein
MPQAVAVLSYIAVVAALIAGALIGDSEAIGTFGFVLFLAASAAFAYRFLNRGAHWRCWNCFERNGARATVCARCGITRAESDWPGEVADASVVASNRHGSVASDDPGAVFVFSEDPVPIVFTSLADAAGQMEAIDVDSGEYQTLYTLDGRVVRASTRGQRVILEVSTERDEDDLRRRLTEWSDTGHLTSDPGDLVAVANELLRDEWDGRWPKRPRWLSRRLHGDGPAQI